MNGFIVAFSNQSFEVCICYHFKDKLLYRNLESYLEQAINNARQDSVCQPGQHIIDKNPYTGIHIIHDAVMNQ